MTELSDDVEFEATQEMINELDKLLEDGDISPEDQPEFLIMLSKMCHQLKTFPDSMRIEQCLPCPGYEARYGGSAIVSRGTFRGQVVAVKALSFYLTSDSDERFNKFCAEAITWRNLRHPHILPLIGVNLEPTRLAMVSEWMVHGNITEFVKKHEDINRVQLLVDAASGLEYMHSINVVHGDLKGANILINKHSRACLADFGFSTVVVGREYHDDSLTIPGLKPSAIGGTPRWMSPELLDPSLFGGTDSRPTKQSDCYALGMVIYEVLCGKIPFEHISGPVAVIIAIMRGDRPSKPENPEELGFTRELWKTVQLCWLITARERPDAKDVLFRLNHAAWSWNRRRLISRAVDG